jgi:hypothetical protein
VVRGRRYTLAMCRVSAKQRMDHVLRILLARLVALGIRFKLLLLVGRRIKHAFAPAVVNRPCGCCLSA